ncbi:hypothetical protein [Marinoscillum furvescens]|uniref:Lipoprotein n=1 Tax=Marinoscillum furvescens DSM 4134 TaxID=1122208 RepID=A0A3D9L036_MARFU|nr:hypothetical protein [Marinoscillum furvescens]RED96557.1 hypothetical protein C7460_11415 [Marinoscillum furvescens DSM 4134]
MKKLLSIWTVGVLIAGCDCLCTDREFGDIKLKLTINEQNTTVDVLIMEGYLDDRDTLEQDVVAREKVRYKEFIPDTYYTGVATYQKNGRTVKVIDGRFMDLKENEDCDCYRAENITLNLRLKE